MANRSRPINKSNLIRNINAAAESRYADAAVKGIENTAKWLTADYIGSSHLASMMLKLDFSKALTAEPILSTLGDGR